MAPSSRKQQTRLTFNPLPSSSPAKTQYNSTMQDRLAGVGYTGSHSKRRKVIFEAEDNDEEPAHSTIDANVLPTPAKSSQQASASQKRSKRGGQDGRLDFSGHIGISLSRGETEAKGQHANTKSTATRGLRRNPFRGTGSPAMEVSSDSSGDESSSNDDNIPHHSSPPRSLPRTRAAVQVADDAKADYHNEVAEAEDSDTAMRRSTRRTRAQVNLVISSDEEGEAGKDDDWDSVMGSDTPKAKAATQLGDIGEPETSGDEVMQSSPMKKAKHGNAQGRSKAHQIADIIREGGFAADDDEELDTVSDSEMQPKKRKRTGKINQISKPKLSDRRDKVALKHDLYEEDNFVVDDEEDVDEEQEEEAEPPRKSKSVKKAVDSEDSEDDVVSTSTKRRRLTQRGSPNGRRKSRQVEDDLAEDLEYLGSVPDSPSRLRSSVSTGRVDPRKEALEEFKRRRAGLSDGVTSSAPKSTPSRRRALYDTESEADADEIEDEDEEDGAEPAPTAREMFEEAEGDDDFIDEDEDPLGVPDVDAQLPLAYSHLRFARAKDLFKYAVEWMVQKKLNPAFDMTDEVYSLAFTKLNDEAQGLTGSKFMSSAWTPEFTRTLKARPQISAAETGSDGMHHCEACNRKSHPATWEVQFNGKPYSNKTLEDLEQDHDDDDTSDASSDGEEDGEHPVYDSNGNLVSPTSRIFHLGRTCQQNASTAHALEHWRYHLNEWVVDYLRMQGHLKPERIVERDAWKTKKRRKFANKVTDEMEESGEIGTLYKVFKAEIEAAHEAKGSGYERYA